MEKHLFKKIYYISVRTAKNYVIQTMSYSRSLLPNSSSVWQKLYSGWYG